MKLDECINRHGYFMVKCEELIEAINRTVHFKTARSVLALA